jgi:hypothetical protein
MTIIFISGFSATTSSAATLSSSQSISIFGTIDPVSHFWDFSKGLPDGWVGSYQWGAGTGNISVEDGLLKISVPGGLGHFDSGGNQWQTEAALIHQPISALLAGITEMSFVWSTGNYVTNNVDKINLIFNYQNGDINNYPNNYVRGEYHLTVTVRYPGLYYDTGVDAESETQVELNTLPYPTLDYNTWHTTKIYVDLTKGEYVAISLDGTIVDMRGISGFNCSTLGGEAYQNLMPAIEIYSADKATSVQAYISSVSIIGGLSEQDVFG